MLIKNCNNIKTAEIFLEPNHLNIKYAANGTGKSTIAKAISIAIKKEGNLKDLTPFGMSYDTLEDDQIPSVSGVDHIKSIAIFNDAFVNQFVFKNDEVLQNSFQIFVKNKEYDEGQDEINAALNVIKEAFSKDESIDVMLADLDRLISAFGKPTSKSSFSAASAIGKGIANGNSLENIPSSLAAYTDYLKSPDNVKWIKWQVTGASFLDLSDNCPFCTAPTLNTKENIKQIGKEFDAKTIEHLSAIIDVLKDLSSYFTLDANKKLKEITTNNSALTDEQKNYLGSIRQQAETLKIKISALKNMSYFNLKDIDKTGEKIAGYMISLDLLDRLASEATKSLVDALNAKLKEVADKAGELYGKIKKHEIKIGRIIERNTASINTFMMDAGYKYRVKISEDSQNNTYKMNLVHEEENNKFIDGKQHLSYGERNAFALILFMHDALINVPDLIVLDDPISSFDHTKKFAITKRLFSDGNSFRNKTVLLLTHDFEPIIDAIYVKRDIFESVRASHLTNQNGILTETPVTKDDIMSFPQLCMKVVNSDAHIVIKAVYLRRYYEIVDNKSHEYDLLSSLIHAREIPDTIDQDGARHPLSNEEIEQATSNIKLIQNDFDYSKAIQTIKSKNEIIELYKSSTSNYLKLQFFRMLKLEKDNTTLMKHINETFHIENEYVMQVDPNKYQTVPSFIIEACDRAISLYENEFELLQLA